jgi:hypothetical protein
MITLIGLVATVRGLAQQHDRAGNVEPFTLPSAGFRRHQPSVIPLLMQHDEGFRLGAVAHLERGDSIGGLLMVGSIADDDMADLLDGSDWFLSPRVRAHETGPLQLGAALLTEMSLTRTPAAINTKPLRWSRGSPPTGMPVAWYDVWDRGRERMAKARYRSERHLSIVELDTPTPAPPEVLPVPKPATPRHRPPFTRAEAERVAAANGADGFGWVQGGQQRRVHSAGRVINIV